MNSGKVVEAIPFLEQSAKLDPKHEQVWQFDSFSDVFEHDHSYFRLGYCWDCHIISARTIQRPSPLANSKKTLFLFFHQSDKGRFLNDKLK